MAPERLRKLANGEFDYHDRVLADCAALAAFALDALELPGGWRKVHCGEQRCKDTFDGCADELEALLEKHGIGQ